MKTLDFELIDKVSGIIDNLPDDELEKKVMQMNDQQPELVRFLLTPDFEMINDHERQLLLYIGLKIWYSTLFCDIELTTVDTELIQEVEKNNLQMIEYLSEENKEGFIQNTRLMIDNHPQRYLLRFAVETIVDEIPEDNPDDDLVFGILFFHIKIFIECLDKVSGD